MAPDRVVVASSSNAEAISSGNEHPRIRPLVPHLLTIRGEEAAMPVRHLIGKRDRAKSPPRPATPKQ